MKQYKVGEFAKLLNVTVKTLQNWDKQGSLKELIEPLLIKDFILKNN